jgi:hypothetical protein
MPSICSALATITAGLVIVVAAATPAEAGYEVWMTDQNNTAGFAANPRGTHGGRIIIHDGDALDAAGGPVDAPEILDLATVFALGSANPTGANVVRPHMIFPSPNQRYMLLSFVGSGHVAIFDGATRQPRYLFRMSPGAGGARQAHAAFWSHDGTAIVVANQNGKLLERIDVTYDGDGAITSAVHQTAATLDLVGCTTPSGKPCQSSTPVSDLDPAYLGPDNRPDNAPICPVLTDSDRAYVTLRGGGLFIVDIRATPMSLVAAYGNDRIGRDGCGGVQRGNKVYLNGGTGTLATNPHEFTLYELTDSTFNHPVADNFPSDPRVFFRATAGERDAHGMALTADRDHLWQFDRLANVAEVFSLPSRRHVATVSLVSAASADPTPDIIALSPNGDRFYAALRGPRPQTGAHASSGSTPGLGIIELASDGTDGALTHVLRSSFTNPGDGTEESDPHGISIRQK